MTIADVILQKEIMAHLIQHLKGKQQDKPKPVIEDEVGITPELLINNLQIELYMDTLFVNSEGILTTIDKTVRFHRSLPIKACTASEYTSLIDNMTLRISSTSD